MLGSNQTGQTALSQILKRAGYVPSLPQVDLNQPMPRSAQDKIVFPEKPYGLPPDWDYRKSERGPNGETLPRGAIGWTPHGDPFYGGNSSTANWLNGLKSRLTASSDPSEPSGADRAAMAVNTLLGQGEYDDLPVPQRLLGALSHGIGAFATAFKNFATEEDGSPTPLTYVSRGISELVGGAVSVLGEAAEEVEQVRGGLIGAAGGEMNPLDQWLQDTTKDFEGSWGNFFRSMIYSVNVPGLLWDAARAVAAPTEDKSEAFREGYEAGRILYTQFIEPAVREEYIRRYRAGENPYLLAEELQNPAAEFGGELLADPLNLIGAFGKTAHRAGIATDARKTFATMDKTLEAIASADKVLDTATAAADSTRFIERAMEWAGEVRQGIHNFDASLFASDIASKRGLLAGRAGSAAWHIIASTAADGKNINKIDETIGILRALSDLHADDAARVATAVDTLKHANLPMNVLMSEAAGELGFILREIIDNNPTKWLDEVKAAGTVEEVMTGIGKRMDAVIDRAVPTLAQRAKLAAEGKAAKLTMAERAILAAESVTKSGAYTFSRRFFGSLYMGYNPGFVARNIMQNYLHVFIDEGLDAFVSNGRLLSPARAANDITSAIGHVPDYLKNVLGVTEGATKQTLITKWNNAAESGAGMQAFAASLKRELRKGYTVIFREEAPKLRAAGMAEEDITRMYRLLEESNDMSVVSQRIAESLSRGYVDVFDEMGWLGDEATRVLDDFGGLSQYKEAMRSVRSGGGSVEDALKAHNDFFQSHFEDYAKTAAQVPNGIARENLDEAFAALGEAAQNGYVAPSVYELAVSQKNANILAEDKMWDVIRDMQDVARRKGIDLSEIYARVPGAEQLNNKQFLTEARKTFDGWANGNRAMFDDLMSQNVPVPEMAKRLGIPDELPPDMGRDAFRKYFWENHWLPRERNYFNQFTDAYVGIADSVIRDAKKIDPLLVNGERYKQALESVANSQLWRDAAIGRNGLGVVGARAEVDAIRKMANMNGIATATEAGVNIDRRLLNTINKYLPEGVSRFSDITDVPADVARQAIRSSVEAKGGQFYDTLGNATFAERGFADGLIPPWGNWDAAPSPARMVAEQLGGIRQLRQSLEKGIRANYGQVRGVYSSPQVESALADATKRITQRVGEAKLVAERTAKATRDFTLLDYRDRKNFDTFLAIIYPYHYWHSRTYTNWMRRIVNNPGTVAAYAKYRDTLEEIHAGAPDWWKYNVNSDELFGLFPDNPLFFNLEAVFNPLNGITGVDFNDPERRVNWWSAVVDDLGKLGPAPWTFINLATAMALQMRGEEDAAARFAGRLIPQTQLIEGAAALAGFDPFNLDPNIALFSGGVDPYTRNRVGRALSQMIEDGVITRDQAFDAGQEQSGEVWDEALQRAIAERAPGQLASYFLGVGFRARSVGDLQADKFYQDYFRLIRLRDTMSPSSYQEQMNELRREYPFMETLIISKKGGDERDTALAYNVLNRLPPGGSSLTQSAGIDQELLSKFYDSRGDWSEWAQSDRNRFMAGIVDMMGVLATPADATRDEWIQVRSTYAEMNKALQSYFGDDILDRVDAYYAINSESYAAGDAFLAANPAVQAALNERKRMIATVPLLTTYYGGVDAVEKYYNGLKYAEIESALGDIWARFDDNTATKQDRKEYARIRDLWNERIDQAIVRIGASLPEGRQAEVREDLPSTLTGAQQSVLAQLQPPRVSEAELISEIGESGYGVLQNFITAGSALPNTLRTKLAEFAEARGMTYAQLLNILQRGSYMPFRP